MRLAIIFLLASITSFGQLINNNMMLTAGRDSVATPYPFFANSITVDSINVTWIDIGADTYVLESANNKTFSSGLTTEYSGSGTDFILTGLSANTKKYFRLKAQTSGLSDSKWVIDSATTFPYVPVAYYDFRGLDVVTNKYADKYAIDIFSYNYVKSVINNSGPTLTTLSTRGSINYIAQNWTSYPKYNHNVLHSPSTSFTFSGDFEVNWQIQFTSNPNNSSIMFNSAATTTRIRMVSLSQIAFVTNTVTLDNALELGKLYWITFQRVGTTFTVIVKNPDGTTQTKSGSAVGTSVTFDRVFFGSAMFSTQCLTLMDRALTSDEREVTQNIYKRPVFVPKANAQNTTVKGLTFSSFSGYYLTNSEFPNSVTGSYVRDKFFGFGDHEFALLSKKFESPYYGDDLLYTFKDGNKVSNAIDLGHPTTSEDIHNSGGICFWNNQVVHVEMDYHYDDGTLSTVIITMFGADMNMIGHKKIPLGKGIPASTAAHVQYLQSYIINGKIYLIAQEWSNSISSNLARRVVLFISDDEWNSFDKFQLFEQDNGVGNFLYPSTAYTEDKILCTIEYQEPSPNLHKSVWIFKIDPSVSETTVSNIDGTFTKNVAVLGPVTETEANTNFVMGTAYEPSPSTTNSVKNSHILYNPATEIAHCVRANGTDDGFILNIIDVDAGTITEEDIPEIIDGHTLYIDTFGAGGSGADNQPFVYQDGSNLIFVGHEVNGGNYTIIRCVSTDNGATWSYLDKISQDDTKPHIRMMPTKNWYYTQSRSIWASRDDGSGTGSLFKYTISTP